MNNKAPRFSSESYTEYVVENEPTGYQVGIYINYNVHCTVET